MLIVQVFLYLQVLDFMTTVLGFHLGASEASPFIRTLMHVGPTIGLALSKAIALALGAVCVWRKKIYVIGWINYWYAVLVVWNLWMIMALVLRA